MDACRTGKSLLARDRLARVADDRHELATRQRDRCERGKDRPMNEPNLDPPLNVAVTQWTEQLEMAVLHIRAAYRAQTATCARRKIAAAQAALGRADSRLAALGGTPGAPVSLHVWREEQQASEDR